MDYQLPNRALCLKMYNRSQTFCKIRFNQLSLQLKCIWGKKRKEKKVHNKVFCLLLLSSFAHLILPIAFDESGLDLLSIYTRVQGLVRAKVKQNADAVEICVSHNLKFSKFVGRGHIMCKTNSWSSIIKVAKCYVKHIVTALWCHYELNLYRFNGECMKKKTMY